MKTLFTQSRKLLKRMGQYAGVEIEPDEQTVLADATEKIPGVLSAGVPGIHCTPDSAICTKKIK